MKQIILIGGAPTVGKSTIASQLSERLKLPWISTDQIRDIMRATVRREDYPKLFSPEGYDAVRFLTEFTAEKIAIMEMEQAEVTWIGIKNFIEKDYTWKDGFIIEGVNILPHLVHKDFAGDNQVKAIFLVDEDADRIRDVVFNRGLWDDADKYPDNVKEKEVEWASIYSHKVKREIEKYGYPWVEVSKSDDDLQAVLSALRISL